jgi:hypothetical protein
MAEATTGLQATPKEDYACSADNEPRADARPSGGFARGCGRLPPLPAHGRPGPPLSLLGDPARRQAAGLERLEHGKTGHEVAGFAPDGPDLGRPLVASLADRVH